MSTAVTLTVLMLAELLLIASGIAFYLYRQLKKARPSVAAAQELEPLTDTEAFQRSIELLLEHTRKRMGANETNADDPDQDRYTKALRKRIEYLEAEIGFMNRDTDQEIYWNKVGSRLVEIFDLAPPQPAAANGDEAQADAMDKPDRDEAKATPLDDDKLPDVPPDSQRLATTDDEMGRLKEIIGRQQRTIRDLKVSLDSKKDQKKVDPKDEAPKPSLELDDLGDLDNLGGFEEIRKPGD